VTEHEIALAKALGCCSFPPATSQKRFARNMAFLAEHDPRREISQRQRHYLELMAWRYRRQLPRDLVPLNKPLDLPAKRREEKPRKPEATGKPKAAPERQESLL
jgi:hypothetical protein